VPDPESRAPEDADPDEAVEPALETPSSTFGTTPEDLVEPESGDPEPDDFEDPESDFDEPEPDSSPPRSVTAPPPDVDPEPDDPEPDDPESTPDPSSWSARRMCPPAASTVGVAPGVDVPATTRPRAEVTTTAVAARALRLIRVPLPFAWGRSLRRRRPLDDGTMLTRSRDAVRASIGG
jgi:hypothetical protein